MREKLNKSGVPRGRGSQDYFQPRVAISRGLAIPPQITLRDV